MARLCPMVLCHMVLLLLLLRAPPRHATPASFHPTFFPSTHLLLATFPAEKGGENLVVDMAEGFRVGGSITISSSINKYPACREKVVDVPPDADEYSLAAQTCGPCGDLVRDSTTEKVCVAAFLEAVEEARRSVVTKIQIDGETVEHRFSTDTDMFSACRNFCRLHLASAVDRTACFYGLNRAVLKELAARANSELGTSSANIVPPPVGLDVDGLDEDNSVLPLHTLSETAPFELCVNPLSHDGEAPQLWGPYIAGANGTSSMPAQVPALHLCFEGASVQAFPNTNHPHSTMEHGDVTRGAHCLLHPIAGYNGSSGHQSTCFSLGAARGHTLFQVGVVELKIWLAWGPRATPLAGTLREIEFSVVAPEFMRAQRGFFWFDADKSNSSSLSSKAVVWGGKREEGRSDIPDGGERATDMFRLRRSFEHVIDLGPLEVARVIWGDNATAQTADHECFAEASKTEENKHVPTTAAVLALNHARAIAAALGGQKSTAFRRAGVVYCMAAGNNSWLLLDEWLQLVSRMPFGVLVVVTSRGSENAVRARRAFEVARVAALTRLIVCNDMTDANVHLMNTRNITLRVAVAVAEGTGDDGGRRTCRGMLGHNDMLICGSSMLYRNEGGGDGLFPSPPPPPPGCFATRGGDDVAATKGWVRAVLRSYEITRSAELHRDDTFVENRSLIAEALARHQTQHGGPAPASSVTRSKRLGTSNSKLSEPAQHESGVCRACLSAANLRLLHRGSVLPAAHEGQTLVFSINQGNHDTSMSIVRDGEVLASLELERLFRRRYFILSRDRVRFATQAREAYDVLLTMAGLSTNSGSTSVRFRVGMIQLIGDFGADIIKSIVPADEWVTYGHHDAHASIAFWDSPFKRTLVFSFDGFADDGLFNIFLADRQSGHGIEVLSRQWIPLGFGYYQIGKFLSEVVKRTSPCSRSTKTGNEGGSPRSGRTIQNVDSSESMECEFIPGRKMGYAGLGRIRHDWIHHLAAIYRGRKSYASVAKLIGANPTIVDERDLAATSQHVFQTIALDLMRPWVRRFPHIEGITLTGGCGLNVILNQEVKRVFGYPVWVPAAPNDGGLATGGAWIASPPIAATPQPVEEAGSRSGSASSSTTANTKPSQLFLSGPPIWSGTCPNDLDSIANAFGAERVKGPSGIARIADVLAEGNIIAVMRGNAEFGPRALGHRSLLADPSFVHGGEVTRDRTAGVDEHGRAKEGPTRDVKDRMNRLKRREWWRPVAPMVAVEHVANIFEDGDMVWSPHMSFAPRVRARLVKPLAPVVHVDGTARVQTVSEDTDPWLHALLLAVAGRTGFAVLCNTSFNTKVRSS